MSKQTIIILCIIAVAIAIFLVIVGKNKPPPEDYSYHFGFPTWGAINNTRYGIRGFNPFMARRMPWGSSRYYPRGYGGYYDRSVRPYRTGRCYSSNENSDCTPGYLKVGRDTDDDGVKDKWQCCRKRL